MEEATPIVGIMILIWLLGSMLHYVWMYRRSNILDPEEVWKRPVHSQRIGVRITLGGVTWPAGRLSTYKGFFVVGTPRERLIFTKDDVIGLDFETGCLAEGVIIRHSLKSAPQAILIRSRDPNRLASLLQEALDAEYEYAY